MSTDHRKELRNIRTFPALIRYLRDEMGWPIESDDFEEVTFDYSPEELGIDAKNAAKIEEIKRLRPLSVNQPWGIFFVKFEPKRLPVVALRRMLSQVVIKKRAAANKSDRVAWAADDLLFISNYGEGEERRITFAHFSQSETTGDMPILKVLGWDNLDTPLHLDDVADQLTRNLSWPTNADDTDSWRKRWSSAFVLRHREVITTSKELSIRLAELARAIRNRIKSILAIESKNGKLTKLMKAFQEALIHDLNAESFADMYAQTITYGLLSARITDPHKKTTDDFADHLRTNPFLRELMQTFLKASGRHKAEGSSIDFDELGINEVVELLDDANMQAVVRDFGDKNPQEDPVIHFYELFLKEYDAKKRMQRGVFYTPRPVVSYIVRSVDELLRTEFGLEDGLADTTTWGEMAKRYKDLKIPEGTKPDQPFVQILDPACGTGTFLVEVIDVIYQTMKRKWEILGNGPLLAGVQERWNEYVPNHLLPRLHGYELLMAPYTVAHLKLGLKLYELGYRFGSNERAGVYLTNALEPPSTLADSKAADLFEALGHEAHAVNKIKKNLRFTVVLGNPPYSIQSQNLTETARAWVDEYRSVAGEKIRERNALQFEKNIQDDYVKFMRVGQVSIDLSRSGIVALVTNHGYLDDPTLRGMRWNLTQSFNFIRVLDLHGASNKHEVCPDGSRDSNVFDIKQGVAIGFFAKTHSNTSKNSDYAHSDIWGVREESNRKTKEETPVNQGKYLWLLKNNISSTKWESFRPQNPYYLFIPLDHTLLEEYEQWFKISDVMQQFGAGVVTARDNVVIDHSKEPLIARASYFRDADCSDEELCRNLDMSLKKGWNIKRARIMLQKEKELSKFLKRICYRPFDFRFIFYHSSLVWGMSFPTMQHFLKGENIGISISRSVRGAPWRDAFITENIIEFGFMATRPGNSAPLFPLYLFEDQSQDELFHKTNQPSNARVRRANFTDCFMASLTNLLKVELIKSEHGDCKHTIGLKDVLSFIYAVFFSPKYRRRYSQFLKMDFPRIPLTKDINLFHSLVKLGNELVNLHLLKFPINENFGTKYIGHKEPKVIRAGWSQDTVWLDASATKNDQQVVSGTIGFRGVTEEVWNFYIGGYQVCEKWLKDRKGRTLSDDDIIHYQKIVVAISETIRIMKEIDEVIEKHGGWPGAFKIN